MNASPVARPDPGLHGETRPLMDVQAVCEDPSDTDRRPTANGAGSTSTVDALGPTCAKTSVGSTSTGWRGGRSRSRARDSRTSGTGATARLTRWSIQYGAKIGTL